MGARHPLPYAFAKAHTRCCSRTTGEQPGAVERPRACRLRPAFRGAACLRRATRFEREAAPSLRPAASPKAYAGGESSAATVVGEVESAVDLGRA